MKKTPINHPPSVVNEEFIEIEIDVTPEEDAELHRMAAADQISVSELLRREALRGGNEPFIRKELVPDVLKSLREMSDAVTNSSTLPPAELAGILLDLANSIEQLIGPANICLQRRH